MLDQVVECALVSNRDGCGIGTALESIFEVAERHFDGKWKFCCFLSVLERFLRKKENYSTFPQNLALNS